MSQSEKSLPPCLAGFLTDEDVEAMMPKPAYPEQEFWDARAAEDKVVQEPAE